MHLLQAVLQDLPVFLHGDLHLIFSVPLPLLLHSSLHARSVETHSLWH